MGDRVWEIEGKGNEKGLNWGQYRSWIRWISGIR